MSQNDERNFGERLIRVEAKLETMFEALDEMKAIRNEMNMQLSAALEKLDKRIRDVEKYIWVGMGGLAVLQVIIAFSK